MAYLGSLSTRWHHRVDIGGGSGDVEVGLEGLEARFLYVLVLHLVVVLLRVGQQGVVELSFNQISLGEGQARDYVVLEQHGQGSHVVEQLQSD